MPLSFAPETDLQNVVLHVDGLSELALVRPSEFARIQSGESTELFLYVQSPQNAKEEEFTGFIQVESESGSANALPITVQITSPSLEGVDADENGVWDYMDLFIEETFEKEDEAAASRQLTRALQGAVLYGEGAENALEAMGAIDDAVDCLYELRPTDGGRIAQELEAQFVNTSLRGRAYFDFSEALAGQIIPQGSLAEITSGCEDR